MTKIVEVIYTEFTAGVGTPDDPFRTVRQLWTKYGRIICESDPINESSVVKITNIDSIEDKK